MKILTVYFLFILPSLAFGQLFPKVPDFRGNLRKVTEKKYGRVVNDVRQTDGKYRPRSFSGWISTYLFDENSRLEHQTDTYFGKIEANYQYHYESDEAGKIVRQTKTSNTSGQKGNYLETETFLNRNGQISKVSYTSFDALSGKTNLDMIEDSAEYSGGKLTNFKRHLFDENGDLSSTEVCRLTYDSSGRLYRIRRTDESSGFSTVIRLYYNRHGWVDRYSVDLLVELQEIGKKQVQDIYYRYDRHGNWKRMYRGAGKKKQLEAKRKNKYW